MVSTAAIPTSGDSSSGGVAILLPAGWVIAQRVVLLRGRAVAILVSDRSAPFYLLSVYLHRIMLRKKEEVLAAWHDVENKSDRVVIAGDFNHADVSTARWNPEVRTLHTSQTNGHKILKLNVKVRPTVLNDPRDAKHETIPTEAFMPGEDGRLKKDNRSLNSLVRLLHRTHHHLFDGLPHFLLDVKVNSTLPSQHKTIVLPPLNGGDTVLLSKEWLFVVLTQLESYTLLAMIVLTTPLIVIADPLVICFP